MKKIYLSVVLLMFALVLVSVTGCASGYPDNSNTIPWDRPDVGDTGSMPPMTGSSHLR